MKTIIQIILVLVLQCVTILVMAQGNSYDERYTFTSFFDDFEGATFDPLKWHPQQEYGRGLEMLVNSDSTIRVRNQALELSMRNDHTGNLYYNYGDESWRAYPFVGGELVSNEAFGYGIYECIANFAIDKGSWAAFWLFGGGGEIDFAEEQWHSSNINQIYLGNFVHEWEGGHIAHEVTEIPIYSRGIHTYKGVWKPSQILFYKDDVNTGTWTGYIPSQPQHIFLSQQVFKFLSEGLQIPPLPPLSYYVAPQTSFFYFVRYKEFFEGPVITCPTLICDENATASLSVDQRAINKRWSLSPASKFTSASGNGSSLIISTNYSSFIGTLTFSFEIGPNNETFSVSQKFWVGKPVKPSSITFVPSTPVTNQIVIGLVSSTNPVESNVHYNWRNTHTYIDQNPSGSEVQFQTINGPLGYTTPVYVSTSNICGTSA